ncbi:MAG: hypothetical protein ACLFUI_04995 [Halanaerobiales bacterium]
MDQRYQEYIDNVIANVNADQETRNRIRQSLSEHIDVLIEKHGSLAYKELDPAEKVAREFSENLGLENNEHEDRGNGTMNRPWWLRSEYPFKRKISNKKIFNLPLYHITDGYNPETGKLDVAKGILAIGPIAIGVFSFGGVALGLISFGGISLGLLLSLGGFSMGLIAAVGGLAIGGLLASGGLAISYGVSIGGMAKGHVAIGGKVTGEYVYNTITEEGNAVEWFRRHIPYFVKYFK